MKLLIVTQTVDTEDPILGFFYRWILEFAKGSEELTVFALRVGEHSLPDNTRVVPLRPRLRNRLVTAFRLVQLSWKYRHAYDAVFVHMTVENIIAAGWLWRLLGKRVALWYTHGTVSWRLRVATIFAHTVYTASAESLRLRTRKKVVMGHGISLENTSIPPPPKEQGPNLLTVGRLSPVKRPELLIQAVALLREKGITATLTIAGNGDQSYVASLRNLAEDLLINEYVHFLGSVPHANLQKLYRDTHAFVHASNTGSLDKAAIEPLAVGVPVVTTNKEIGLVGIQAIYHAESTLEDIADKVSSMLHERLWDQEEVRKEARNYIASTHELTRLIERLLAHMAVIPHRRDHE